MWKVSDAPLSHTEEACAFRCINLFPVIKTGLSRMTKFCSRAVILRLQMFCVKMAVSSTYIAKWTSAAFGMSMMHKLKSLGHNKDPCGTPLRIGRGVETVFNSYPKFTGVYVGVHNFDELVRKSNSHHLG
ncbi:hypothetical protein TNCV_5052271 [Trichonephila clavipes]|nr:hypothetical protein TNCV_5052271 [Trichonephila clavipes]